MNSTPKADIRKINKNASYPDWHISPHADTPQGAKVSPKWEITCYPPRSTTLPSFITLH